MSKGISRRYGSFLSNIEKDYAKRNLAIQLKLKSKTKSNNKGGC